MVPNVFDVTTTKQISTMLLAAGGALTFSAFNMVAAGVTSGQLQFAADISEAFLPLKILLWSGLVSFVMAVLADHSSVPDDGGRWSKKNLLETAFAFLSVGGLVGLVWAVWKLIDAATIKMN